MASDRQYQHIPFLEEPFFVKFDHPRKRSGRGRFGDGRRPLCLKSKHPWKCLYPSLLPILFVSFPISSDVPCIADRKTMIGGSQSQMVNDLEGSRLLTFNPVGIEGVDEGDRLCL